MLSFANINEAWGETKKRKPTNAHVNTNTNVPLCDAKFGSPCSPIVIRITDPRVVKDLSIYNDDYKYEIIMDMILKGMYSKKEVVEVEPVKQTEAKPMPKLMHGDPNFLEFIDEEYKEIICVVAISLVLLFIIETMKQYNKM